MHFPVLEKAKEFDMIEIGTRHSMINRKKNPPRHALRAKTTYLVSAAILLSGCTTTLNSKKIKQGDDASKVGSVYYLPQQTINVAVTYELQSCVDVDSASNVKINRRASVSTSNSPDGNAKFEVPVDSLSAGNKTTSLTLSTFDDGTLRSLGATIDDRTSEAIGGIVGSVGSIISTVSGISPVRASLNQNQNQDQDQVLGCSEDFKKIVKDREILNARLRNADSFKGEGERAGAIDALNRLTALTRYTRTIPFTPDPNEGEDYKRVSGKFDNSEATENRLSEWLNKSDGSKKLIKEELKTAICIQPGLDGGKTIADTGKSPCGGNKLLDQSQPSELLDEDDHTIGKNDKITANKGLVYRDPKSVAVLVCGGKCDDIIGRGQVSLAQFGPWRYITLESKAFQDKNVMASWNNAGRLTSLTFGASSSLGAVATTLNTSAASIRTTVGELVTTDQEALNAEIALIRAQADLIEQRNRLDTLQNASTDNPDE